MQFRAKQIAPPKEWGTFEDLCHALFKQVWQDPLAQKNGRRGQAQYGVDVFGSLNGDRRSFRGVQCKGKDSNYGSKVEWSEAQAEIAKLRAAHTRRVVAQYFERARRFQLQVRHAIHLRRGALANEGVDAVFVEEGVAGREGHSWVSIIYSFQNSFEVIAVAEPLKH